MTDRVVVMLTMRDTAGKEWTVGRAVEAVDDIIEMEIRDRLIREFLVMIRESKEVEVM